MFKIGLDPGHGGDSSGTYSIGTGKDGLFEKDYALDLCLKIEKILNEHGFATVLTRRTDINPGNVSKRAQMLVDAKCDYAVSMHFNGFETEGANGTEVFVPYSEKFGNVETGYQRYLSEFFKLREPFARSNSFYNRNDVFDKKLNLSTKRFEAYDSQADYFGFIRTAWEKGLSADLLEVCFLTNPKDFKTYTEKTDEIASAIARSIIEGFGKRWEPKVSIEKIVEPGVRVKTVGRFEMKK